MERPFADKRPFGPFAQTPQERGFLDEDINERFVKFKLSPPARGWGKSPSEIQDLLDADAEVVERDYNVYEVRVFADMTFEEVEDFIDTIMNDTRAREGKVGLVTPPSPTVPL